MIEFRQRINNFTILLYDSEKNKEFFWHRVLCQHQVLFCSVCNDQLKKHEFMYNCLMNSPNNHKICGMCIHKMENNHFIEYLDYLFVEWIDGVGPDFDPRMLEFVGLSTDANVVSKIVSTMKGVHVSKYKMAVGGKPIIFGDPIESFKHYIRYKNGNQNATYTIFKKLKAK